MSDPTKPSPFELASIAVLLASQNSHSGEVSPEKFFSQAERVLNAAQEYQAQRDHLDTKWLMDTQGYTTYTFEEVLKTVGQSKKKPRTMVGSITTLPGLKTAIHRIFSDTANGIWKRGSLSINEIDAIKANQKRANQARTQAATKARK